MDFKILGAIVGAETIARGRGIRELRRLERVYGPAPRRAAWRKRKGVATVRLSDGVIERVEVHWYEAYGLGQFEFKIKRFL